MPDAAPPVNRYRRSLSRSNNNSAVLAIVYIPSTLHQWFPCGPLLACHLTWLFQAFSFRVHDLGFCPQPPQVVWNLLLQAGSEGPTLISQIVANLLSLSAVCCARGTLLSVILKLDPQNHVIKSQCVAVCLRLRFRCEFRNVPSRVWCHFSYRRFTSPEAENS
jgi:hypothetical protein